MKNEMCPCHSGKTYAKCCKPFHEGGFPDTALQLMRSRYSAYARHLSDYIMRTTHHENPHYRADKELWKQEILSFCHQTQFQDLEIVEFIDSPAEATVTFKAHLLQNGAYHVLTEKSSFEKVERQWLYRDAVSTRIN